MKLLRFIQKNFFKILPLTLIIIIVPILIVHILYYFEAPCEFLVSRWTAGELLAYFGNILGAFATIIAVVLTMLFTIENEKLSRKLSVKPYLKSTYNPKFIRIDFDTLSDHEIYLYYDAKNILINTKLPFLLEDSIKKMNMDELDILTFNKNYYLMSYELDNVGAGNAVDLEMRVNRQLTFPSTALKADDKLLMLIIIDGKAIDEGKVFSLHLNYSYADNAGIAKYIQEETIDIFYKDNAITSSQKIENLLSKPTEII